MCLDGLSDEARLQGGPVRAETMADECPLTEQEQAWLDGGISEFNTGRYWHAHEDWEDMWKSLKAREADARYILGIQGLIQTTALMVAKRDGRREEFNRDKLTGSILKACVKRPLPTGTIEKLVDDIDAQLQKLGRAEIPRSHIGEMVMRA